MQLDKTDKLLLQLLQTDSKQTNKELSLKLNLSVTAVYERIKKLERSGIISQYVALIDKKKVNQAFIVFCHVRLVQHTRENVTYFEREITKLTEVLECYHINGDYDYMLKVAVTNMDAYREFMVNKLTKLQHIANTHSVFMMGEVKHTTAITL